MIPSEAGSVFDRGRMCWIAAATKRGPHCTPVVFARSGAQLWVTTARDSVKARAWRRDPSVAGLVRDRDRSTMFSGRARLYDALDPTTWARSLADAPSLGRASMGFVARNARFFAGYAVDAHRVPLAWTPPGRVFAAIDIERTATVSDAGEVLEASGRWSERSESLARFRVQNAGPDVFDGLGAGIADALGRSGECALALEGGRGVVVMAARWSARDELFAASPAAAFALAGSPAETRGTIAIDRPSAWRARDMVGAMFSGSASCYALAELSSGAESARTRIRAIAAPADAESAPGESGVLVRLRPERTVWWRGWESATVGRP